MSKTELSLDVIRQKVFFLNSIDVWISACTEKNIAWFNIEKYKKFISYLIKNNLQMKAFNLCSHEAGATEERKTKFADILSETKESDPNTATYTIKLNNTNIDIIRKFNFD